MLLRDKVHSLAQQGHRHVVLNLGGVPSMDSAGIGEIVGCSTTRSRVGSTLTLLNLTTRIHDLLAITKLLTVFESFITEDDAVRSFPAAV